MLRLYANTTSIRNQVSSDFVISGGMGIPENILLKKKDYFRSSNSLIKYLGVDGKY